MSQVSSENIQRWSTKRKASLVLSIMNGETSVAEVARKHSLTVAEIEDWKERALLVLENSLRSRPKDEEALKGEQIKKLKQNFGELVIGIDTLKKYIPAYTPKQSGTVGRFSCGTNAEHL